MIPVLFKDEPVVVYGLGSKVYETPVRGFHAEMKVYVIAFQLLIRVVRMVATDDYGDAAVLNAAVVPGIVWIDCGLCRRNRNGL